MITSSKSIQRNALVLAQACQKKVRGQALKSQKTLAYSRNKARKMVNEMMQFWRRNDKEEKDSRKKSVKEDLERRKLEEGFLFLC